jgi:hypothetical protein
MRHRNPKQRRCTYVVAIEKGCGEEIGEISSYLATIAVADCDVLVLDASPRHVYQENGRFLRWTARHMSVPGESIAPARLGLVRTAVGHSLCDKVIIASPDIRYTASEIDRMCDLLDDHEVVEPVEYLDPLPWWGTIEAGRLLVQRGLDSVYRQSRTFGFRRSAIGELKMVGSDDERDSIRQLAMNGAEVFAPADLFVRRRPPLLADWLRARPADADRDFVLPFKSAFFLGVIPMTLLLATGIGLPLAAAFAATMAFVTGLLALRGRAGASAFFPLRTCAYAPLWVLERSVSVYWALFRRIRAMAGESRRPVPNLNDGSGRRTAASQ